MIHLDLFSGIGGFAYAADQVWDNVTHIFCDNEPFAQAVLKKHWPESEIYNDIRQINSDTFNEGLERLFQKEAEGQPRQSGGARKDQALRPFILTGGFPCQPFSAAGLRRGTADDRHLWPEMLRVIRLTKPEWVIAENVGGLITWNDGLVLEQVCADLEAADYTVQPFIIPAAAVNAPHRRDRIWFVAHANQQRPVERGNEIESAERNQTQFGFAERNQHDTDPHGAGLQEKGPEQQAAGDWGEDSSATNPGRSSRGEGRTESPHRQTAQRSGTTEINQRSGRSEWDKNWLEVATEFCSVDDGLPAELDGSKLSKPQHRAAQIKAYGNAIVPEVALEIMRAMV